MPLDPKRVEAVFAAALDLTDPAARADCLARECSGDGELRQRVEALLAAYTEAGSFLDAPDAAIPELATGPEVAGRDTLLEVPSLPGYEVLAVLGRGGMGLVLKARDTRPHRIVALKLLAPELAASDSARARFTREARAGAAIDHEHVVAIHDVGDDGPLPYLVMEFIDGTTLDDRLKQGGLLPLEEVLRISVETARALAAAHGQGLIHRDVKPGNLLLENDSGRVRVSDFGLARAADDVSITQSGVLAGTPLYMSPEQAEGEPLDARSDLFSFGSVLYTLCAGRPAFAASNIAAVLKRVSDAAPTPLREINPAVPPWLEAIIARLMAMHPGERFQSAEEVAGVLERCLAHVRQPRAVPLPRIPRSPRRQAKVGAGRRRWRWAVAGSLCAVLLATAAVVSLRIVFAPGPTETTGVKPAEFVPPPPTEEELALRKSPLDGRKREQIPAGPQSATGRRSPRSWWRSWANPSLSSSPGWT
jgi:serine/threonine protein kinase